MFHRDHPTDPRVVLQVPNEDRTDAATYIIRMDVPEQAVWLDHLPRCNFLKESLSAAQHIRFDTETGDITEIEDIDAPTPVELAVRKGRTLEEVRRGPMRQRQAMLNRRRVPMPESHIRQMLRGRLI